MAEARAIDMLCKAFSVEERSSYTIKKGGEVVIKLYWKPLTIADRDSINKTMKALNLGRTEDNLDFAIQMLIRKAEDEAGNRIFSDGDRAKIQNRLPMSIVLDVMSKMQGLDEVEEADELKSKA
tara:strand:+ start:194 stop:565 length:372 start_codon:yes stop_codon:yes gene_type:complete